MTVKKEREEKREEKSDNLAIQVDMFNYVLQQTGTPLGAFPVFAQCKLEPGTSIPLRQKKYIKKVK